MPSRRKVRVGREQVLPSTPVLTATAVPSFRIDLSWTASSDASGIASYTLQRSTNQATWTTLLYDTALAYADTGLQGGTLHYYRVSAVDTVGNRSAWALAQATTLGDVTKPTAPIVTVTGYTSSSISLSYGGSTDNVGVTSYVLQWFNPGNSQWVTLQTTAGASTYTHQPLASGTTYQYRCYALDAAGNQSDDGQASAMTTISPVDTSTRVFHTNFAGLTNANWQWTYPPGAAYSGNTRYSYNPATWPPTQAGIEGTPFNSTDYSCGDTPWLLGVDTDTGQIFDKDHPALFGLTGANVSAGSTFRVNYLTAVNNQMNIYGGPFMAPSKCFQMDFKTGVDGPSGTGITTALRLRKKRPYRQPDQLNPHLYVAGSAGTNKMIYTRQWTRFLSAAKSTSGVGWIDAHMSVPVAERWSVVINNKMTTTSQGFRYTLNLMYNWRTGLIQFLSCVDTQSTTGTVLGTALGNWDQFHVAWHGPALIEDKWYLVETAIRPGNTPTRGAVWCAIDGVVICNKTTQTVGDGVSEQHSEHMPFPMYGSFGIAGAEREVTGHETWESIPSDASTPHDLPLNTNLDFQ